MICSDILLRMVSFTFYEYSKLVCLYVSIYVYVYSAMSPWDGRDISIELELW